MLLLSEEGRDKGGGRGRWAGIADFVLWEVLRLICCGLIP